jgi:hypothetical protein
MPAQIASQRDLDDLDPAAQQVLHQHAEEISSQSCCPPHAASSVSLKKHPCNFLAAIHYLRHTLFGYIFTLLTSPQTVVVDPVGKLCALIVLPLLHIALLIVQPLFLLEGWIGAGKAIDRFCKEYGSGLSMVNMVSDA